MSQADINRLIDTARPHLPGAVDAGIMLELFSAVKEFFTDTHAWGDEIDFETNETDTDYVIAPAFGSIVRLFDVVDPEGRPVEASMPLPGVIRIFSDVPSGTICRAKVSLTVADPTDPGDQPQMPLWVFSRYHTVLLDGLLGRMMSQPAKPYSNSQAAVIRIRRFNRGVAVARTEVLREYRYNGRRWRFPKFGV